jgi:hypothetical protein
MTDYSSLVAGDLESLVEQMKEYQETFSKCTWCKETQFKNNYCVYCGHDLRIDWNKRRGIYSDGYIDKEGFT